MRASVVPLVIAAGIAALPAPAHACTDGGPRNSGCAGDAGPAWISCRSHDDCPEGQVCDESASCGCGCMFGEQICDETGCRCCGYRAETTCAVRFECAPRDAGVDAGADAGVPMDSGEPPLVVGEAGMDAGEPADAGSSCSVSHGRARVPISLALLALAALLARRRR